MLLFLVKEPFFQHHYLTTIRKNALGDFRTLLLEVTKSPAVLYFLNANRNAKENPNENFSRELLELYTLGRGNYTELDIKEGARIFTGYRSSTLEGIEFKEKSFDNGVKEYLGTSGNHTWEDAIDIILEKKETAHFTASKFYRYFVNSTVNDVHIKQLANVFYKNDYDITCLLKEVVQSKWLYKDENVYSKIKSPIELWVGMIGIIKLS
jgi:uncharacterized protein (DUF1800 family)